MQLREFSLNGYIDDEVWFGDEITPDTLHDMLYEPGADRAEDVHIRLNSYGGSCNAAVRIHDDLAAYPGRVSITISGTAASAATVLAMGADLLEITPGSLFMIHDPVVAAIGNEADLMDAIRLLRTCKESILNVYEKRSMLGRDVIAGMMRACTWMDAEAALSHGFVDRIATASTYGNVMNCAVARDVAEKKVQLWIDRHKASSNACRKTEPHGAVIPGADEDRDPPEEQRGSPGETVIEPAAEAPEDNTAGVRPDKPDTGIPIGQLRKRLALIMPVEARKRRKNHE